MKVGDLVTRKIKGPIDKQLADKTGKIGIIIEKNIEGDPAHACVNVFYGNVINSFSPPVSTNL